MEKIEEQTDKTFENSKYNGVDAKVYLGYKCNGKCPFCLTEVRPKTCEASPEKFLESFETVMKDYHENGGCKILFTGGEPTEYPEKLFGALKILKQYNDELVVLYTNGTHLLDDIEYDGQKKTFLEFLRDLGQKDINMSVHHYDQSQRLKLSEEVGKMDTEKTIGKIEQAGLKLRLNCTLMRDFIGSKETIEGYIKWATDNGVHDIYFRDLFHLNKRDDTTTTGRPEDMKKLEFSDEQRISFYDLVDEISLDPNYDFISGKTEDAKERKVTLVRHRGWGNTIIFRHKPTGARISFGTLTIGEEKPDEVTYFTVNPDGHMTGNMNRSEFTTDAKNEEI
jgi:MoaA/NifB/PqqE/SkfB family radical SAM enzyme